MESSSERTSIHGEWSSRLAFVLAATGSAVGLGNVWKFPYIVGENGGGAFVLVYLACVALIGLPIMMAEVLIGRRGRQSPINTMRTLAAEERRSPLWTYVGYGGVLAGFIILSYYSVVAGWAVAYVVRTGTGMFDGATADGVGTIFSDLVSDPERVLAWQGLFLTLTMIIVSRGVRSGLERSVRVMMPVLLALLLVLVGYATSTGKFQEGFEFLFQADFSKLSANAVLVAMGHAFFTLSLGMGAIMVYGSYLPKRVSIARTSLVIVLLDTCVALLAGLAIFPVVFANGLEPAAGPGLIFQTLPIAFGHMDWGRAIGSIFFILLSFAAWSSAISLIEPAVAWLVENRGMTRVAASVWCGMIVWVLGIGTVLSFGPWSELTVQGKTFFDLMDVLTANVMLPLGGLAVAVFAGWAMRRSSSRDELAMGSRAAYEVWRFVIRYIAPAGVLAVFLNVMGFI